MRLWLAAKTIARAPVGIRCVLASLSYQGRKNEKKMIKTIPMMIRRTLCERRRGEENARPKWLRLNRNIVRACPLGLGPRTTWKVQTRCGWDELYVEPGDSLIHFIV